MEILLVNRRHYMLIILCEYIIIRGEGFTLEKINLTLCLFERELDETESRD